MLSNIEFRTMLNNIFNLPVCQRSGISLLQIKKNKSTGAYLAKFSVGSGSHNIWILQNIGNSVYLVNGSNGARKKLTVRQDDPLQLDDSGISILSRALVPASYTIFAVLNTLIHSAAIKDTSDDYEKLYYDVSNFLDSVNNFNLAIVINNKDTVKWSNAADSKILSQNINDVNSMTIEINGIDDSNSYVPLFRIVIGNGIMSISRYVKSDKPKLSADTSQINIKTGVSVDRSDERSLYNQLHDAVESWVINHNDSTPNMFGKDTTAVVAFMDKLKAMPKVTIINANGKNTVTDAMIVGYGIDDFYDCYPLSNLNLHIGISHSAVRRICISYSAPMIGTIAELYFDADVNKVKDSSNLGSTSETGEHNNYFAIDKHGMSIVRYNTGTGDMAVIKDLNINEAFSIVRDVVSLSACVSDIAKVTEYNTALIMRSEKMSTDFAMATVMSRVLVKEHTPTIASATIHSRTNNSAYTIKCTIEGNSTDHKLVCSLNDGSRVAYDRSKPNGIYDQCMAYINGDTRNTLGKVISDIIRSYFSANVMHDRRGRNLSDEDNQQTKVYNALKFQSTSELGGLLLDVRDALISTFGPGVIGTPDAPSKFSSKMNTSKYNYNVSNSDNKPVVAEFNVANGGGGMFIAKYDSNGEPRVYCGFSNKYRIVSISNGKLSDGFLKWYLQDCGEINIVSFIIYHAVLNNETQKTDSSNNVVYEISPKIIDLIKEYYDIGNNEDTDPDTEDEVDISDTLHNELSTNEPEPVQPDDEALLIDEDE